MPTLRYHIISKCLEANDKLFFIPQGSIVYLHPNLLLAAAPTKTFLLMSLIRKSEQKMKNEFCWTQPKLFSLNWCKYITVFSQELSVVDVKWQVLTYLVGHE